MLIKNRYRIVQELAKGGFGETSLAEDVDRFNYPCVIKQLTYTQEHPDYDFIQKKFQQEAKVLQDLGEVIDQIPGLRNQIPKLYAYFTEGNRFHLVQEWIPGQSLADHLKTEGLLNEEQVRRLLIDLLPVLALIHHRGMVHRDIKPGNLMIREADGKPVLIDFGIVKELAGIASNPDERITELAASDSPEQFSTRIGTPGFMAPEQEWCQPIFPSTDLYSLGITAIYALTGKSPKRWVSYQAGKSQWHHFAPQVSQALTEILDKAIQPSPRDRYSTAQDMLEAIQSLVPLNDFQAELPATTPMASVTEFIPDSAPTSTLTSITAQNSAPIPTPTPIPTSIPIPNRRLRFLYPLMTAIVGSLIAVGVGYFYSKHQIAQAKFNDQVAQADLKKIENLKAQGEHQACITEAKRFTQLHTSSYLNPAAEAKQLGDDCATEIVKSITTFKEKGDHAACITKAQQLTQSQSTSPSNISEAKRLEKECAASADLQNYLRVEVPKLEQKNGQPAIAKVISTIQASVQVENDQITIIYDGSTNPDFVTQSGLQRFTAFFISALSGQSKEYPTTKYADFSSLVVSPKGKSMAATVTKAQWDTYLEKFNRASSTTEREEIQQQFIEKIQVSTQ